MKKFFPVYVRVPLLFTLFFGSLEFLIDSGDQPAFIKYPYVLALLGLFLFILIAIEITASAVNNIINQLMTEEERQEKERRDALRISETDWYKKLMKKLTKAKPIESEHELVLDHDFDGIQELDNDLPPWWVYLFYATIIFGFVYLAKYHLFGGDNQATEYEKEVLLAQAQIEEYKKTAPDMLSVDQVTLLTDAGDLAIGKKLFDTNCAACHRTDGGGGIGPNLTDEYWILGGDIKDIFTTIMEGGRDGKGMVAWKAQIKPSDIQKISSYILTLQGSNPPDAKAPEGDKHSASESEAEIEGVEQPADSLATP